MTKLIIGGMPAGYRRCGGLFIGRRRSVAELPGWL